MSRFAALAGEDHEEIIHMFQNDREQLTTDAVLRTLTNDNSYGAGRSSNEDEDSNIKGLETTDCVEIGTRFELVSEGTSFVGFNSTRSREQERAEVSSLAATRKGGSSANGRNEQFNVGIAETFNIASGAPKPGTSSLPGLLPRDDASNQVRAYFKKQVEAVQIGCEKWITKPEIPCAEELFPEASSSRRVNLTVGAHQGKNDYLSAHYEFAREEAVKPLRDAIELVRRYPTMKEPERSDCGIGIYNKVYLTGLTMSRRGIGVKVAFSLSKVGKNIKWDQSKRLMTGTLVALSRARDQFSDPEHTVIAVVAARPMDQLKQSPPMIDLFFARPEDLDPDTTTEWVMVEARSGFFEAQRHTMLALQKMTTEIFPLANHLVDVQPVVEPPSYVLQNPVSDLSSIFPSDGFPSYDTINLLEGWPRKPPTSMDESQLQALNRILTKRLALIQGPPGTGKTYVSVVALKAMLAYQIRDCKPIIIACQTNHALDQILRQIAEIGPHCFARLGGRSRDTTGVIEAQTLFNLKKKENSRGKAVREAALQIERVGKAICEVLGPLELGKVLDYKALKCLGLLTQAHCDSLEAGDTEYEKGAEEEELPVLQAWVGKKRIKLTTSRDFGVEEFGYDYEEPELDTEQLQELEAETRARDEDDDVERLNGHVISLMDTWKVEVRNPAFDTDAEHQRVLDKNQNLWKIKLRQRASIYRWLEKQAKVRIRDRFRALAAEYSQWSRKWQIAKLEDNWRLLQRYRIIGMTTTGLSKYRSLVASLMPKVVLIEEAGETLEAPIIAACTESLEHLVLVGDHQQLRPQCNIRNHEQLGWNISLFERLINNNVEFSMLQRQRRMIPEIRRVLYPFYGSKIMDHPDMADVSHRPRVEGMGGVNSYFFSHTWEERRNDQMSVENADEAEMIIGLVLYLVHNGLRTDQITILTFYNGQRSLLLRKLRREIDLCNASAQMVQVVTVDSYQGEENEVVILSTVRSNTNGNIGFLANDNRVCVALSRAKRGFYIFGNAEALACESKTWSKVVSIMAGPGTSGAHERPEVMPRRLGFYLPLQCTRHGHITFVNEPHDWVRINGGCEADCDRPLPCGHLCPLRCHGFGEDRVVCEQRCKKLLPCGHLCRQECGGICKCIDCNRTSATNKQSSRHSLNKLEHPSSESELGSGAADNEASGPRTPKYHESAKRSQRMALATQVGPSTDEADMQIPPWAPQREPGRQTTTASEDVSGFSVNQQSLGGWQEFSQGGFARHDREMESKAIQQSQLQARYWSAYRAGLQTSDHNSFPPLQQANLPRAKANKRRKDNMRTATAPPTQPSAVHSRPAMMQSQSRNFRTAPAQAHNRNRGPMTAGLAPRRNDAACSVAPYPQGSDYPTVFTGISRSGIGVLIDLSNNASSSGINEHGRPE